MDQPPVRDDGLQLEEHRKFQESFWRVERIAWIGFGCILLLAILGMTGSSGYFARQALAFEGGLVEIPGSAAGKHRTSERVLDGR